MTQQASLLPGESNADIVKQLRTSAQRSDGKKGESKEDLFAFQCRAYQLPTPARQAMFAKAELGRRWMFDFCWHAFMVAVEIEGLDVHVVPNAKRKSGREFVVGGRHASVDGIQEDMVKYNSAALLGWTVLRFSQRMVKSGEAVAFTQRVLAARGWKR